MKIVKVIQEYNSYDDCDDLLYKQISLYSLYHLRIGSKKWWWPLLTQMLVVAVVNTWGGAYETANKLEKNVIIGCVEEVSTSIFERKNRVNA
jgi:hypothetical protein